MTHAITTIKSNLYYYWNKIYEYVTEAESNDDIHQSKYDTDTDLFQQLILFSMIMTYYENDVQ